MKETKEFIPEIIDDIAKKGDGLTVPDGFFDDFAVKMSASLPFREELDIPLAKQSAPRNSKWLRIRPYVYMAAMFAGAWCMLKMFSLMSTSSGDVTIDNYPTLSKALQNEQFVDEYILDGMSQYDFMDDAYYGIEDSDSLLFNEEINGIESSETNSDEEHAYILPTDAYHSNQDISEEINETRP